MTKVDSKGRIVLPQRVRERLGITPGTTVDVHEDDGKAVIEPEADPDEIIDRMEQLIEETATSGEDKNPLDDGADPIAEKHRDAIKRGAATDNNEK